MKRAFFGGTFDPIHKGHLLLAEAVAEQVDEILFCPAAQSPFKGQTFASGEDRLAMVKLAIDGEPKFKAIDLELNRPSPSYTIDTLKSLQGEGIELFIILGEDVLKEVSTWRDGDEILRLATPLVAPRTPTCSSAIREKIKNKLDISADLDQKVLDYITKHHLYFPR
ncbi:MAG: Nicotinate-nucleotide adenylyltransferase [Chlamydiia bacterium]|nr:Nicotinate-nucleotide adenylyltransferase [Chlamydiia bacterium]MCH9615196.1 Nicotinate-nucleotide adenylyltransferase [Chlamydiia bacterium]MCH9628482.1 Nicotinate-nucleotide adenylyltransferase [Chlamydiia bacterium]